MSDQREPGPRAAAPVVWLLALVWLGLQHAGRGGTWLMGAVDRGTTVAAGAGTAAVRALIRALGPAGRALVRLVTPVWRLLCRGWEGIGRRVFLAMARPLGRFGRWLLARSRPAIARVLSAARQAARLVAPGVRRLEEALAVVERRAARWGALIDRAWAPVQRFARTVRSGRGR